MVLSILIPVYNTERYLKELMKDLKPQLNNDIEVIIFDDGSDSKIKKIPEAKIIRSAHVGVGTARNKALEASKGDYIAFIDSDDRISGDYVESIFKAIEEDPDLIYISWTTADKTHTVIADPNKEYPSQVVAPWTRVYKRSFIGDHRFNPNLKKAGDAAFQRTLPETSKKAYISNIIYFYEAGRPDSISNLFKAGRLDHRRIIYNLPTIPEGIEKEIEQESKTSEVIVMTKEYAPQLEKFAMIIKPGPIEGTELRGSYTPDFKKIVPVRKTQVAIWIAKLPQIGGIETFIYNFCQQMRDKYDILVLYNEMDSLQLRRLQMIVRTLRNDLSAPIECDTLIINRITDTAPVNVHAKKTVQMIHSCKLFPEWKVPKENDVVVHVSEASKRSYSSDGQVIHNFTYPEEINKPLLLVSATRSTSEKGIDRMKAFAELLNKRAVSFIWLVFVDGIFTVPENMVLMKPRLDIKQFIKMADYCVQLSDSEGFGYTLVESLELGTPLITTPVGVLDELGIKDGENAYVIPFEITEDIDTDRIKNDIPKFDYEYDNESIIKQWRKILGDTKPFEHYQPEMNFKEVEITTVYKDVFLDRIMELGEKVVMPTERAEHVISLGYAKLI